MLNKTFLLTRSRKERDELISELKNLGAEAINFPLIEIKGTELSDSDLTRIKDVNSYDAIIFTSVYSAGIFLDLLRLNERKFDGEIFCVGDKTKQIVELFGYQVAFHPKKYSSEDLLKELPVERVKGKKILFPKGNKSMTIISSALSRIAYVSDIIVYENFLPEYSEEEIESIKDKLKNKIDCVVFFSPSAVENYEKLFGRENYSELEFAVIGNTTLSKAEELGLNVKIKPVNSTIKDLIDEIKKYYLN
jgi:uroporphyrinogen-III synthase